MPLLDAHLTFEKDKEDQSEYYLNYPKPPVLGMMRENHNVNALDDIVSLLRLLENLGTACKGMYLCSTLQTMSRYKERKTV